MKVEIGNDSAIERYEESEDTGWKVRPYPGQHVTTLIIPDDRSLMEAAQEVVATLGHHMEPSGAPRWIESDSPALLAILCQHYKINDSPRPPTWGHMVFDTEKG